MTSIGVISNVRGHEKCFDLTTPNGELIVLFFEELRGQKFIQGDIISFETIYTEGLGLCALNPIKTGNIYLKELMEFFETKQSIKAYIYNRNEGGYEVSYNGYRCFLPNVECSYNDFAKEANELLDSYHYFTVISVIDGKVIVSLEEALKSELEQLKIEELRNIKEGFQYMGEVISVKGYGLFVSYKYTEGLLHISKIIEGYDNTMNKVQKNEIAKRMEDIFLKEEKILVTVSEISDGRFSVDWDKSVEPNKGICQQLRERGVEV